MSPTVDTLVIRRPDDWHLHLRDGAVLESVLGHTAAQFDRAIVMPNLTPPVTSAVLPAICITSPQSLNRSFVSTKKP